MSEKKSILQTLKRNWSFLVTILAPFILILIPVFWKSETGGKEPFAAYTITLMAVYWCTEAIPLSITSFLPVVLYPLFGIYSSDKIASSYLQDSILFLFGGCLIALSFEYCNLHTRIAMKVIMVVGARISQLMVGIMFTTCFLSMFMNNTSTTAMMVPIVGAMMEELRSKMIVKPTENPDGSNTKVVESEEWLAKEREVNKQVRDLKVMFLLATAYSSNIGGTGVITGSGTNVVALDLVRKDADDPSRSPECRNILEISFIDWMLFNVPPMIVNTIICWVYLQVHFLGLPSWMCFWRKNTGEDVMTKLNNTLEKTVKIAIREKYESLGPITFHEYGIIILFLIMIVLWVFKDPQVIPGWDALPFFARSETGKSLIKESTPTLLICFLMFVIPRKKEYFTGWRTGSLGPGLKDPLMSWDFVFEKFPWGIFILLGGGSAMAAGAKESGLNKWIENLLSNSELLKQLPGPILLLFVLVLIACLTSVASNTATAAIVTPVLLGVSYAKNMHPLYLVYAATTEMQLCINPSVQIYKYTNFVLVCSYAFILPVSTPPNAIVYSSTDLKLSEMVKPGIVVNIICIAVLILTTHTTSTWIFGFNSYNGECSYNATSSPEELLI